MNVYFNIEKKTVSKCLEGVSQIMVLYSVTNPSPNSLAETKKNRDKEESQFSY